MPGSLGSERVLLVTPFGRDAPAAAALLERGGFSSVICPDIAAACEEATQGVGVMVVAEEASSTRAIALLSSFLEGQPPWSDVPLIALARERSGRSDSVALSRALQRFNVTILERPLYVQTFLATVHVALRARRRQYEVRSLLEQRSHWLEREREARERAESASRAKDDFLAMLGHELRNPLSPIVTAVHLLRAKGPAQRDRELVVLERQVSHLSRLVDDLLDVSRIAQGKIDIKREPVPLEEIVSRAIEMTSPLLEQRQHRFEVQVAEALSVSGDATRLSQVLANLLTNAAKYTPPGGRIRLGAWQEDREVVVSVKDDGIGIAPELLPSVFDLFVQGRQSSDRSTGGLGLGLAIVRNLVWLHGGIVEARSDGPGRGSEFIVRLPAMTLPPEAAAPTAAPDESARAPSRALRVLIVDDNEDSAEMLALSLSDRGCSTRTAHSGPTGLAVAEEFKPDVAVLDIGLPVMDGYEVARRLRANASLSHVRLIALTGYGQPEDVQRARDAGFDDHFVKPVDMRLFLDLVDDTSRARSE